MTEGCVLELTNLGDSGVRIIRGSSVFFKSAVLQHEWNMPYQMGNAALLPETDTAADARNDRVPCEVRFAHFNVAMC